MGNALSAEQQALLDHRCAAFSQFLSERYPCLVEFFSHLGFASPELVRSAAHRFLDPLHEWLQRQVITEDDRIWLVARVGPFVGELFAQEYGGQWLLCANPNRASFARFVVGFGHTPENGYLVDAFEAANAFALEPPPRSLRSYVDAIHRELAAFQN